VTFELGSVSFDMHLAAVIPAKSCSAPIQVSGRSPDQVDLLILAPQAGDNIKRCYLVRLEMRFGPRVSPPPHRSPTAASPTAHRRPTATSPADHHRPTGRSPLAHQRGQELCCGAAAGGAGQRARSDPRSFDIARRIGM
jgi:hypothetical protein